MNFNTDVLQMWIFRKLLVIVVSSNKPWKIGLTNSLVCADQKMLQQKVFVRAFYHISQVERIFSLVYYISKQPLKLPRNSSALNYLGASDKAIKLSFFPAIMRAFRNWAKEFLSIASPCFHVVSFVSKFIGNFPIYK